MAERSFATEVQLLRNGAGTEIHCEGILAVTKALLESGVAYVGGYQGAPISHLMDVLGDANPILEELGVYFENSASEATAAAMLAASVHYPLRGAITFKSTVGTNVASDALANLASGGVTGGALIIVGEDYGEGSSIMQERSHAFAMKSQMWLLDPRPNIGAIVAAVKAGFELSEVSNTPVMLELRLRSCHLTGSFVAEDNVPPAMTVKEAIENPRRDLSRIVLPPASFLHEQEKIGQRWPAAVRYITENGLNEVFGDGQEDVGIIVQGGVYNTLNRALELLGCSDPYGRTKIPMYVMNVTYPVVEQELVDFCSGKRAVLMVEEGQPDYLEQNLHAVLRRHGVETAVHGKDLLPMGGEYTAAVVTRGLAGFLDRYLPDAITDRPTLLRGAEDPQSPFAPRVDLTQVQPRPPGLCTGCPERPVFAAMKLVEQELGLHHVSADIGCHLFSILPPFNIGATTMGFGLGPASASAFNVKAGKPPFSVNSAVKVPKLNASSLAGKTPDDFVAAGSVYSKAESDSVFAKVSGTFSRNESDDRYPRTLLAIPFAGTAIDALTTVVVDETVSIPSAGTVMVVIERTMSIAGFMNVLLNGVDVGGSGNDDPGPVYTKGFAAPGSLQVQINFDQNAPVDSTIVGHVNVIFIPAQ